MSLAPLGPIETHPDYTDPKAYCAHLMTQSRSSFTLGMKAMSKPRREAIFAVYAFCRVVDDIADEPGEAQEKRDLLQAWREEINQLYDNSPRSLIGRALLEPIDRFQIPKQEFILMINGMEADVNGPLQAPNLKDLLYYTRCVAGTVGIMSIRIFGVSDCKARDPFALHLADALQLTNILRDVEEDATLNRLYLPAEYLKKHGIETDDPALVARHEKVRDVCRALGGVARARFIEARRALESLHGEPTRSALMMMGVYETYLERMERADFRRDPALHTMNKWQKLGHGLRYAFFFPRRSLPEHPVKAPPLAEIEAS